MIDDAGNKEQEELEHAPVWRICDHMDCPHYGEMTTFRVCVICGRKTVLLEKP